MKIERAIEILDPEHRECYDGMDEVNEACRMGMEALERTRWIPCYERLPEKSGYYRVTVKHWKNLDPWECCGQDNYCMRPSNKPGGCRNGCIVPKLYTRLAQYEDTGLSPAEMHLLPSPSEEEQNGRT